MVISGLTQVLQALPITEIDTGTKPFVIVVDGKSGTGKSTLATELAKKLHATYIDQDDFYTGGVAEDWQKVSSEEIFDRTIDWRRVRKEAIEPLLGGKEASWHPFDWDSMEGLSKNPVSVKPSKIIILDGTYSSRQELEDVYDFSILLCLDEHTRIARLKQREGVFYSDLEQTVWDRAENYYFEHIRSASTFDLIIRS